MNSIHISGNLTREPEAKSVGEQSVIKFSIANNDERHKKDTGEWESVASFFECEYWTKNPAHWLKQLVKGCQVVIEGRIKQDRWQDKDGGGNREKTKIIVIGFPIVAAGKSEASQPTPKGPEQFDDDQIPF